MCFVPRIFTCVCTIITTSPIILREHYVFFSLGYDLPSPVDHRPTVPTVSMQCLLSKPVVVDACCAPTRRIKVLSADRSRGDVSSCARAPESMCTYPTGRSRDSRAHVQRLFTRCSVQTWNAFSFYRNFYCRFASYSINLRVFSLSLSRKFQENLFQIIIRIVIFVYDRRCLGHDNWCRTAKSKYLCESLFTLRAEIHGRHAHSITRQNLFDVSWHRLYGNEFCEFVCSSCIFPSRFHFFFRSYGWILFKGRHLFPHVWILLLSRRCHPYKGFLLLRLFA